MAGSLAAGLPLTTLFRLPLPRWLLRWLLMDSATPTAVLSVGCDIISQVPPELLAARLRDALRADCSGEVRASRVRIVALVAGHDRLLGRRAAHEFGRLSPRIEVQTIAAPHFLLQCAPQAPVAAMDALGLFGAGLAGGLQSGLTL